MLFSKFKRSLRIVGVFIVLSAHLLAKDRGVPCLAFSEAKVRADSGEAYAQAVVAMHYQLGWQVEKSQSLAVKYAEKSAAQGHPLGLFRLGSLNSERFTSGNEDAGADLKLRSLGGLNDMIEDPYALTALGTMYFRGGVVLQDRSKAAEFYRKAADLGFAPAQHNYAICLLDGQGVAKNEGEYQTYIDRAIAQGYQLSVDRESERKKSTRSLKASVSTASDQVMGIEGIGTIIAQLPAMVEDSVLLARLAAVPVDTEVIVGYENGVGFVKRTLSKEEYLKILANKFRETKALSTFASIREQPTIYEGLKSALQSGNLKSQSLAAEVANMNNQIFTTGTGQSIGDTNCIWIACANGVLIVNDFDGPTLFIPREIVLAATHVVVTGRKVNKTVTPGSTFVEGAEGLSINTSGGSLSLPVHRYFTFDFNRALNAFSHAFNLHKMLYNLSLLQNQLNLTSQNANAVGTKLIGYPGLSIGMPQEDALSILRETIDYAKYQAIKTFNCESPEVLKKAQLLQDALGYLADLQFATGGLILAPPWTVAFVVPRSPIGNETNIGNHDVFYFQDKRLVACARYPNVNGSVSLDGANKFKHVGNSSFQKSTSDLTEMNALLEKYGSPSCSGISVVPRRTPELGNYFQLIWRDSVTNVGGVFKRNGAKFTPKPGTLDLADRFISIVDPQEVPGRGVSMEVPFDEIDFRSTRGVQGSPSLICTYYWTSETAKNVQAHLESYTNRQSKQDQQKSNEVLQKTKDQF
jgi:hypothetical protein